MSKIDQIEKVAGVVSASTIYVHGKRCSAMRNWNSRCRACTEACKHEAIKRSVGRLSIDDELCTNCGACACACPTSTFTTTEPGANDIVRSAREAAAAYGNIACFACQRDADALNLDTDKVVVLPCLNYLDEYLVCGLLSVGIENVALLRNGCEGCTVDNGTPRFEAMVAHARKLLRAWKVEGTVKIFDQIPDNLIAKRKVARRASTDKREAIAQTGGTLMDYAVKSVADALATEEERNRRKPNPRIIVSPDDVEPAHTYKGVRLLKMLDKLGQRPYGQALESSFWASVTLDDARCKRCGLCARSCATRALRYEQQPAPTVNQQDKMPGTLTFTPSLCMGCDLCKDVCVRRALQVNHRIMADDLDEGVTHTLFENQPPRFTRFGA